jgi:hypothetical protein
MLPKLDVPIYEVKLISNEKIIRFRPFLVKEQKLFLMAAESEDGKETINVIRQVLKNCVLDEIDIDTLPTFDLEYLFMNMRARSVEEVVDLQKTLSLVRGKKKYTSNHLIRLMIPMSSASRASAIFPYPRGRWRAG